MQTYLTYLMKHLLWPTLLITGTLTCIIWLTQALRFIDFIVNRGLSIGDFIYITSLLFPSLLLLLVPVSLFVAVLYTYNRLMSDSELVVMRAAGLSPLQLAAPALVVAAGATLFSYAVSLYFLPLSSRQFNEMSAFLRDNYTSVLLQEEVFNSPVDGLTVFVREREDNNNLKGILVHDNRDVENPITMMAEEGMLQQGKAGPQFYLVKGIRQELRKGRISWLNFDNYTLDISFYTGVMGKRDRKPEEYYIGGLLSAQGENEKATLQLRAEAHQRLTWPLYNVALTAIALAALLSGQFNRRGLWKRNLTACVSAAVVALVGVGLRNLTNSNAMMAPAMYGFVLVVIAGCVTYIATSSTVSQLLKPKQAMAI